MPEAIERLSLPAAPAPSGNGAAVPMRRFWRGYWRYGRRLPGRLLAWITRRAPPAAPSLQDEFFQINMGKLRAELHDREQQIFRLKTELELARSEILVKNRQIQLMAEVHEADRARVAADTAAYNAAQADHDGRRERGRG